MAKGFTITPKRGIKLTPGKEGKLLPETGKFSIYGKKKPQLLPSKPGRKSQLGGYGAVNRYYDQGGRKVIARVYSKKYRAVPAGSKTYAVRLAGEKFRINGEINEKAIGWVSESGQLTTLKDFRDSLISLDATTVGRAKGNNVLVRKWDALSFQEKAKIIDSFADYDWEGLWTDFYPSGFDKDNSDPDVDKQYKLYDKFVLQMNHALK